LPFAVSQPFNQPLFINNVLSIIFEPVVAAVEAVKSNDHPGTDYLSERVYPDIPSRAIVPLRPSESAWFMLRGIRYRWVGIYDNPADFRRRRYLSRLFRGSGFVRAIFFARVPNVDGSPPNACN